MTKSGISAAASGTVSEETTPVSVKASGPATSSIRQPRSALASVGTAASTQTIESSDAVRVTDETVPTSAQAGTSSSGSRRTTA